MLGVKQHDAPITQEYLDIIEADYRDIYGEELSTIIKENATVNA